MKHIFLHKNLMISLVLFFFSLTIFAQKFQYTDSWGKPGYSITNETKGNLQLNYSIKTFEIVGNEKATGMVNIELPEHFLPNDAGMPDLPGSGRYIAIPQGAEAVLNIKNFRTEIIQNVELAPALPIPTDRDQSPQVYEKNMEVYSRNAFYPENPIFLSEKVSVRGVDAVVLGVTPFQYNPVTKELKVYKDVEMEVAFEGGNGIFGEERLRSPYFDPILANLFINYSSLEKVDYSKRYRNTKDTEGCEYLIVIPNDPEWRPYAEQLKEWRTKQGILTKIMSLDEIGQTSVAGLKTFFHDAYNTWSIPPVAVLLMADYGTNPQNTIIAESIYHSWDCGNAITDNKFADPTGDNLPDMIFARMAAENISQLQVLVSKGLEYESNPPTDADYYHKPITALGWQTERWFQICSEVVGGYWRQQGKEPVRINAIYEGTPGSQWSTAQNTTSVVNHFGPNGLGYLPATPSELGNWSGGTATQVVTAINSGAFALQHRDHGNLNGWGEPRFTNSHINQLNNVGKLTFVFSINCETGKFDSNTPCFGEVFHRHTYQGQNAGALGVLAPTQVSYSFVNDCFVWGVFDYMDPNFMPAYNPYIAGDKTGNWMPAFGNANGKYFLSQSNWPYNTSNKEITYHMFTAHCDAFLRLFTEVPQEMEVIAADEIEMGTTEIEVSCPEGAIIACTIGDIIIAVETAASDEPFTMTLPAIDSITEITMTCTKQNYLRYTKTISIIEATPPEKPKNLSFTIEHANHVILTWEEEETEKDRLPISYNIYRNDELISNYILEEGKDLSFKDVVLANGRYEYKVTELRGPNESEPSDSVIVVIDGMCVPMGEIFVEQTGVDVLLTWNAPDYDGLELAGYYLFRGESMLNPELIPADAERSFLDENVEGDQNYCYQVTVVYLDCMEEFASEEKCIDVVGIDEQGMPTVQIFPNPAQTQITVSADNMNRIVIYNMLGQTVKELQITGNTANISIADIPNGTYIVQIHTEKETLTGRVSVVH